MIGSSRASRNASDPSFPADRRRHAASGGGYRIIARPESFASTAAAFLARKIASLGHRDGVRIALSGGGTPGPVYRLLADSPLPPWDQLSVYFADERAVPRDDPASNYRLVRETLLNAAPIPTENVHPMMPLDFDPATLVGPEGGSALGEIARSCEKVLPDRFDVVVLGLGEDGHTASLFPGSPALQETERRVMPVEGPTEPRLRLTITPPVIAAARLLVVLVSGASKAPALRAALRDGSPGEVPGRLARSGIWLIGSDSLESSEGK